MDIHEISVLNHGQSLTGRIEIMDVTRLPKDESFSVKTHRDLADKVLEAERSLVELAKEMGISVEALRRWSLTVERAHETTAGSQDSLVPSSRVRELEKEIESLKSLLERQAEQIQILKAAGPPRSKSSRNKPRSGRGAQASPRLQPH
jgi:hypothetical protein